MIRAIPEESYLRISAATHWIPPDERAQFLQTIADELARVPEIDEGVVARVITRVFKAAFNPPLDTDGHHRPRAGGRLTLAAE
jgi:hypothetical protein